MSSRNRIRPVVLCLALLRSTSTPRSIMVEANRPCRKTSPRPKFASVLLKKSQTSSVSIDNRTFRVALAVITPQLPDS
ncbi:hypothetical protein BGW80DRAFT_1380647 [Lactifluus volemus]|nr:hypothetical protein BGW80DRAFT_1380647 [Lactifluus volemus]